MKPGTSPGFPAIAYAMYPASTGRSSLKDAPPMSFTSFQVGAAEKSGPEPGVMGTNAMLSAIKIPPQAMNGIANETPVSSACLSFWIASIMGGHAITAGSSVENCPGSHRSLDFAYRGLLAREGLPWPPEGPSPQPRNGKDWPMTNRIQITACSFALTALPILSGCVSNAPGPGPAGTTYAFGHLDGPLAGAPPKGGEATQAGLKAQGISITSKDTP